MNPKFNVAGAIVLALAAQIIMVMCYACFYAGRHFILRQ